MQPCKIWLGWIKVQHEVKIEPKPHMSQNCAYHEMDEKRSVFRIEWNNKLEKLAS